MIRPPLVVVFMTVLMVALGATAGAVMSQLRPETERYARDRIAANADAHGLISDAEYDDEVIRRAVFTAEAGLSFLHTHAEGLGPLILLASTLTATLVRWRLARGALHALLGVGVLFPLGYLVYALAVLERGRDAGLELAEWYVLTPLGSAAIVGLAGLFLAACLGRRQAARP
ncbi:MAG: hypothetical protein ACREJG_12860 [Candidatus Rokuibacteriota bacterium]